MSSESSNAPKALRKYSFKGLGQRARSAFKAPSPQSWNQPTLNVEGPSVISTSVGHESRPGILGGKSDTIWMALGAALRGLEGYSKQCPPLVDIVAALVNSIELVSGADKLRQDYIALASDLTATTESLRQYLDNSNSSEISLNLGSAIQDQINHINQKQQRRVLGRYTGVGQDEDDIIECYRRIESHFRRLQINATMSMLRNMNEQTALKRMHLNRLSPSMHARYNSSASMVVRRRNCTPNTRMAIRREIHSWANTLATPKIYWLNGMAGTGKTTVVYSICEQLDKACQLGASFFCSRLLPECRNVMRLVPTIAYQLAQFSHPFRTALCDTLAEDQDASTYNVATQFEKLVKEPLLEVMDTLPDNMVVVIDALDELSGDGVARAILDILLSCAANLPVRFLVSCRPEPGVHDHILAQDELLRSMLHLHDIERSVVQTDIQTYLTAELQPIGPSANQIRQLTEQAGNLFIYAATALRYILPDRPLVDPGERLEIMLKSVPDPLSKRHRDIDVLYATVLSSAFEHPDLEAKEVDNIRLILYTVVCAKEPMDTKTISLLLGMSNESKVQSMLRPLCQERSGRYWCDEAQQSERLAQYCFKVMEHLRAATIYLSLFFSRSRTLFLSSLLTSAVLAALPRTKPSRSIKPNYLCSAVLCLQTLGRALGNLSQLEYTLHITSQVPGKPTTILDGSAEPEKRQKDALDTLELSEDAQLFVAYFATNAVGRSTPHIYVSMLPFWPKSRPVWKHYGIKTRMILDVDGTKVKERSLTLRSAWNNNAIAYSIAVSSDGTRVAAGSGDSTISIWDSRTGIVVVGPCEGHSSVVWSVAFSPDDKYVASGSGDFTIRVWNASTGDMIAGPFEVHNHVISSVAFSHDGARIISCARDSTICVWESCTGALLAGPLKAHSGLVTSAHFSSDNTRITSISLDQSVCVWDTDRWSVTTLSAQHSTSQAKSITLSPDHTRVALTFTADSNIHIRELTHGAKTCAILKGHTGYVSCVAFSRDGTRLVSGSEDKTIRVWDAWAGVFLAGPFEGHTNGVCSVAFLPGGNYVVSASRDRTIRIWDTEAVSVGTRTFEGHTAPVHSVAFSPDGSRIVSGSYDQSVRVWDAQTGAAITRPLIAHNGAVKSVTFSPDGTRIASGSSDHTVCVWDAWTGKLLAGPLLKHNESVNCVAYSPDGNRVVSGSHDGVICVWNAETGTLVFCPLESRVAAVCTIAFSPDGTKAVSGHHAGHVYIWDVATWTISARLLQYRSSTHYSTVFSADGTKIISGSLAQGIRIWDVRTMTVAVDVFKGHSKLETPIAFSSDTKYFVSGLRHCIRTWDLLNESDTDGPFEGHTDLVHAVAFSPDNTQIVSGSGDCTC
ncbi:hypothetical protein FRC09_005542 [Ceratobasidium sp. 395]|nr:hypothetical protein FRC09_005542 [Ceratobasidium sp. 395]